VCTEDVPIGVLAGQINFSSFELERIASQKSLSNGILRHRFQILEISINVIKKIKGEIDFEL
jgi:hypothetical protein